MNQRGLKNGSPDSGAALRVMGTSLDLAGISRNLGQSPTHLHRAGDLDMLRKPYPHDMWMLESPLDSAEPLDAHLKWLQATLAPHHQFLLSLQGHARVDIYCNYTCFSDQNGLELSPEALKLFTELNIRLGISILAMVGEETEDTDSA